MKTEVYDNPADFLKALNGGSKGPRRPAREARPNLPRAAAAARGDGERLEALGKLAKAGWVRTNYQGGEHWLTHWDGSTTPRVSSYRQMIDDGLKLVEETQ